MIKAWLFSIVVSVDTKKKAAFPLLLLLLSSLSVLMPVAVEAQEWATKIRLSDRTVLSMVTIYPGDALYSMFGHTAIRVNDPVNKIDILYNYGQSSVPFDASFVPHFVQGDLPFILGVSETGRSYDYYTRYEDRSIYEQVLELSIEEKQDIFGFLAENARKENRTYIYDFFFDNCTTRIRDMFEELFGQGNESGSMLRYEEKIFEKPLSYRSEIAPYLEGKVWVKFGIDLVLGLPTDGIPGREQQLYLPLQLMEAVETAGLDSGDGEERRLMSDSFFVYEQQSSPTGASLPSPPMVFWGIFLLGLGVSFIPGLSGIPARIFDMLLFVLAGLIGIASVTLWVGSGYLMTHWNLNLLWAWPTHIFAAFFLIGKKWGRIPARSLNRSRIQYLTRTLGRIRVSPITGYLGLSAVVSLSVLLGSPLLPQEFPPAVWPFVLTLVLRAALRILPAKLSGK